MPPSVLNSQANICLSLFDSHRLLLERVWAEEQAARFQLWAASLGVFAHDRASADWRLRNSPEIIQIIFQMLGGIAANLDNLTRLTQPEVQISLQASKEDFSDSQEIPSSEDSSSDGSSFTTPSLNIAPNVSDSLSPVEESKADVEDIISRLNRIARFIRQSSSKSRNLKAEKFAEKDDTAASYFKLAEVLIDYKFRGTIHSPKIRERLAISLSQRRNRLAWVRHKQPTAFVPSEEPEPSLLPLSTPQAPQEPIEINQKPLIPSRSDQSATTYEPPLDSILPSFSSKTSSKAPSIISKASFRAQILDIPNPPKVENEEEFWCPYCGDPCLAKEASKTRWRSHLMKDLMPYVCLFENCSHSLDVFRTFNEWILHTQTFHCINRWACVTQEHKHLSFEDETKFSRHLNAEHDGLSSAEILEMKIMGRLPGFQVFDLCLFCGFLPDEFKNPVSPSMTQEGQIGLQRHVGYHLELLALLSVSWVDQAENSHSASTTSEKRKQHAVQSQKDELEFEDPPPKDSKFELEIDKDWNGVLPKFEAPEPDPLLLSSSDFDERGRPLNEQWDFYWTSSLAEPYMGPEEDETLKELVERYLYEQIKLEDRLYDARIEWPPNQHRYFIPIGEINTLMTIRAITKELSDTFPQLHRHQVSTYAATIHASAKKLYAVLLCTRKGSFICSFINEGILDRDLPFVRSTDKPFQLYTRTHATCSKIDHKNCGMRPIRGWSSWDIEDLSRDQWLVQAPVFQKVPGKICHQEFDLNTILPFVEDHESRQDVSGGGYSHVWGVRIHPSHQTMYSSSNPKVKEPLLAIKRPYSRDVRDFKKETNMLSTLAATNHKHLMKLLATYKYNNHYHLIFPFANANLRSYWDATSPYRNRETYLWFARQIHGLASGLNTIHNFKAAIPLGDEEDNQYLKVISNIKYLTAAPNEAKYGRHGDIKPENILWSNELPDTGKEGILLISDMGLGRFHKLESRSGLDPKSISGSPTYAPPEAQLELPISRAYDIWSLGCVYLEFITWLLEGGAMVNIFAEARDAMSLDDIMDDLYYTIVSPENQRKYAVIRPGVLTWITRLRKLETCSEMIRELLDLIEKDMLAINSQDRIRCADLESRLSAILSRAEAGMEYLLGKDASLISTDLGVKLPKGPKIRYDPRLEYNGDVDSEIADTTGRGAVPQIMAIEPAEY